MSCKCYSGKPYKECCGKLHKGEAPSDALALMRSRYCAYALGNIDYLVASTHKDHILFQQPDLLRRQQIKHFCDNTVFSGLEIIDFFPGETESTVTFRAILSQGGKDCSFTEKSLFKKVNGFWKYYGALSLQ